MSLKQRKIKFKPRIKLNHNIYVLLIFISRQNKLVCAQRASKKITRFVPLLVHLLQIRRLGQLEYIAEAKIWHFFPPPFFPTTFVYICKLYLKNTGLHCTHECPTHECSVTQWFFNFHRPQINNNYGASTFSFSASKIWETFPLEFKKTYLLPLL